MNIASLNGVKKKSRDAFFDKPIEVGNSLVSLPALVADGLFVDVLLGANWMKAVSARLDVGQLEVIVDLEKLKLKKLPDPARTLLGLDSRVMPLKWLRLLLAAPQCVE